ncbi:hypothetical protein GA0070606_5354 [Micromonospora citrea]|uniref:Uncharacterized protein n=1 Tax=Micromonospora citrea TaxID=47855 RepID=A0A1C6VVP4_9ACTN|nr:hypothetical protein [Micromonospora citrea]SCL70302.1 hypothetical protein GA0070606_5354 [Micromonospora citrea]
MTSAEEGGRHDGAVAQPSAPRERSHWAQPWILLVLALPGAVWSWYAAIVASAPFFGEEPSPVDRATTAAAFLSGASLWLTTALLAAVMFRRAVVPVLCGLVAAGFAALALSGTQPRAPLSEADIAGSLSAWTPPTSWALVLWGLIALTAWAYGRLRGVRHADR